MPIKQFADTSAVSIAYAIDDAADSSELTATGFNYVPYTSEGFQLSKESQSSTAITSDRRPSGSKNTQGSASGSVATEFGYAPFILDMISLAMMSNWVAEVVGGNPTGAMIAVDGEERNFFVVEKRIRGDVGGVKTNFFERYYGNLVNEATLEIGGSDLISFTANTMAVFGDTASADASLNDDAGGLATTYTAPGGYEIADATNNISNIVVKDSTGTALEVVWSDATLTITNNVREQGAIGSEFAAGMAMGKVGVQLSGTIYYYDDTVLRTHLDNGWLSAEITVVTDEGTISFTMPRMKAEAPNANSQGENQDYTQSLTLTAERGKVSFNEVQTDCVLMVSHTPA